MKILTADQIRELDAATVVREGIDTVDLVERAAEALAGWVASNVDAGRPLLFLVGKGGNGADGLAMARILFHAGFDCTVLLAFAREELGPDAAYNLRRLPTGVSVVEGLRQVGETLLWLRLPPSRLGYPSKLDSARLGVGPPRSAECAAQALADRFPNLPNFSAPGIVIIDALLGTGLRGAVEGPLAELIKAVNNHPGEVIAIDIPSGMAAGPASLPELDGLASGGAIIDADTTLTIEFPKLAMLLPEMGDHCGRIEVVEIGLDQKYIDCAQSNYFYFTAADAASLLLPECKFAHKGSNGSALLVCGSAGMAGAAVLAAGGALRSGCGLVKVHMPSSERMALLANYPSAMISEDPQRCFSQLPDGLKDSVPEGPGQPRQPTGPEGLGQQEGLKGSGQLDGYSAIGVGPGLGTAEMTVKALGQLLERAAASNSAASMVIDADALNIIAANPAFGRKIPRGSILTPHPGELRRLVGEWGDERQKIASASELAALLGSTVVVKGAHTMVCMADGRVYFNSTGNSGMAKGGSGDVLTGLLAGLVARGYSAESAALLGVWLHGAAGDRAAEYHTPQAMNSADIIDFIGDAFREIDAKLK